MSYTTISGLNFVVELLRHRISDPKYTDTTVIQEDAGEAAGTVPETYYTDNMPISSGFDTHLRAGRWYYEKVDSEAAANGIRAYTFSTTSGSFTIPSLAIAPTSGDRIQLSYSWREEQETRFSDIELKMYIADALNEVNQLYDFGFDFVASGIYDMFITPTPTVNDLGIYFYIHYATYLIKKELESEGFGDRIYVKDITTTIDTSKGLGDLLKSSKDLLFTFNSLLDELRIKGQEAAFSRIDTYGTYNQTFLNIRYNSNYQSDSEFF